MIIEWLIREGWIILSWWFFVTVAGLAVLPLCARLLGALPDRGYLLARTTGLLLVGYAFWILGSLGFLRNTSGSIVLSWLIVFLIGLTIYFRSSERFNWRLWWRENRAGIIVGEVLFLCLLCGWALVRAHLPDLRSTEKPMDLMFISSIMRSPTFPPNDGWMAGYSISYYYFGYFIAAMLSSLSGVTSTIGYSMTITLVVALTGLTAYGVGYNLVRSRGNHLLQLPDTDSSTVTKAPSAFPAVIVGLLTMFMIVFMGNFQLPMIELPFRMRIAPEGYLSMTGTQDRGIYPERQAAQAAGVADTEPILLQPQSDFTRWGGWWWFRSSRVLNDYDLTGQDMPNWYAQPIDEFPQFSFLLADNHPHVTTLPYVLLALGLALNLLLLKRAPNRIEIVFYALCIGSLVFLNTWDGPIYILALVGAEGLRRLMHRRGQLSWTDLLAMIGLAAALVLLTILFYLPFLISFRSQASGLLPNLITPTFFGQFFIMFGPFILILAFFLGVEIWRAGWSMNWIMGIRIAVVLLGLFLLIMLLLIWVGTQFAPDVMGLVTQFVLPFGGLSGALGPIFKRRLEALPTTLILLLAIIVVVGRLFPRLKRSMVSSHNAQVLDDVSSSNERNLTYPGATAFALLLVVVGAGLILVPEFFFLRDNFNTRINTVFKFYYQAWIVFSVASGYAIYSLLSDVHLRLPAPIIRGLFGVVAFVVLIAGLMYPVLGIYDRSLLESGRLNTDAAAPLTLDGGPTMIASTDYQSIICWQKQLSNQPLIVVEALGGAYNPNFGRVAGLTGVPLLLGWENHESQWRGSTYPLVVGNRSADIPTLYKDLRWETAQSIIQRYKIDYIFYGTSERQQYGTLGEEKFQESLTPICAVQGSNGQPESVFYRVNN